MIAAPDLREMLEEVNAENLRKQHKELPAYSYPDEVVTSTMLGYLAAHGVALEIDEKDTHFIRALDSQKKQGKGIFGSGFLISEKAAAEKAAATIWEISDREREIIQRLG